MAVKLSISVREVQGITILDLDGKIKLGEETKALRERVEQLLAANKTKILLNMEKVDSIDSGGIGALTKCLGLAQSQQGQLKLCNLNGRALQPLVVTAVITKLDHYKSETEALATFA